MATGDPKANPWPTSPAPMFPPPARPPLFTLTPAELGEVIAHLEASRLRLVAASDVPVVYAVARPDGWHPAEVYGLYV